MIKIKFSIVYLVAIFAFFSSCQHSGTVFTELSSSTTKINFENKLEKKDGFGILYYLYYYNGGGVSVGDINNDGLPDIYFTANSKGNNKLYLNKGNFEFEDITQKAGVAGSSDWCTGSTMADVNGDGLLDIYVSSVNNAYELNGHNELFINNGNGTFTESSAKYGLNFSGYTIQTVFFDYDHDGDLDCFILNESQQPNQNLYDTTFRNGFDPNAGDFLFRNDINTTGKFTDVSKTAGISQSVLGYGLGLAVADINNDGWEDIYVGNDFHENDYYYVNNHDGTFSESGAKHFNHYSRFSMGNDVADFNNDGQLDILTVDMLPPDEKTLKTYGSDEHSDIYNFKIINKGFQPQFSRNCLQQNNGNGKSFSDIGLIAGVSATDWSWSPLMADFDNDGNKDIFISSGIVKRPVDLDYVRFVSDLSRRVNRNTSTKYDNVTIDKMPEGSSYCFMFQGKGTGEFTDVGKDWGLMKKKGFYNGAAYADLDNDGNLDLIVNSLNSKAVVFKNTSKNKNHLTVDFKGDGANKFGIGAKAYVFAKNKMQYEQLMLTRGFQSSTEPRLHFGLDSITTIDSVVIVWPNQKYQRIKNVQCNKPLTVQQRDATNNFDYNTFFTPKKEALVNITDQIQCNWKHEENNFDDYNVQYFIPHKESTRGPKIAVGDVNKDGLEDFYACGAKGQPGALMIQQSNGTFVSSDTALFNKFRACEDVDAVFFDANGDGYQDLWVVGGGNEMPTNEIANADRLFLNDGNGHFTFSPKAFQQQYWNKSCIAVADIDHDGDMDVFIGHLCDQQKFGFTAMSSYLYINNGKGKFSIADNQTMNLLKLGMVTSASFADLNKDGWPDLVVTGEWMGVKIFMNNKGKFKEAEISASTGLWQTLFVTDINGDGYPDLLAGNWGHNSKLWAGKNGPLKMYVKDFDHNGIVEQIMCYTINGQEYTFLPKDELEQGLPILKKAYLTYSEVAGKTVQYMFYDLFKDYTEWKAETLGNAYFINDGKGNFKKQDMPFQLQLSPIMAFQKISDNSFITGGNFFDVVPYEGFYDAASLATFSFNESKNNFGIDKAKVLDIKGQVRDLKWIHTSKYGNVLIVAKNNSKLEFYTPSK